MGILERTVELNTGAKIPLIGFGTAAIIQEEEEINAAIATALQVGYRHFDTASLYRSEGPVGKALNEAFQNGVVKREEVFVTTKLWHTDHDDPVSALKTSLENLQLEYIDLYLVHWPVKLKKDAPRDNPNCPREEDFLPLDLKSTWQGMEECMKLGLTKAIGVSNFSSKKIEDMLSYAKIPPAVDQVEMHPMWQQKKLRQFCGEHNIHVTAFSPLGAPNTVWGTNTVIENPVIQEIAQKHGKTRAQVMLRWGIEQGVSVSPKSYKKERISENFQIFDWSLDAEDHEKLSRVEQRKSLRGEGYCNETTSPYKTLEELWDGEI